MRTYPSFVAGLNYASPDGRSRGRYAARRVRRGDVLDLVMETENPHDANAVALHHRGFHLGYVPARHGWVGQSLREGDTVAVRVVGIETEKEGWFSRKAMQIAIQITILKDG